MARRARKPLHDVPAPPWTAAEDEKLAEICSIGLASGHWHLALPGRRFGDIATRRLDLGLKMAPLL